MLYIITWTYLHIGTKRDELCFNTFPQTYIHSTLLPTNYTYTCLTQAQTAAISTFTQQSSPYGLHLHMFDANSNSCNLYIHSTVFSLQTSLKHVWRNLKQLQSLHSLNSLLPTDYTYTCLRQSQTAAISICTQNILHILDFNNTTTLISQLVLKAIVRWSYFWILEIFCLKVENSMREESFLPFVAIGKIYLYCF